MADDVGFAVQEALARNDRRALGRLAPCACDADSYATDTCPAQVWNGCRALEYEEWDSRGSDWEYQVEEWNREDPADDIPGTEALAALIPEISKTVPMGWGASWQESVLLISHETSDHVFCLRILDFPNDRELAVNIEARDRTTVYETLGPFMLPPRMYFTVAWILHILRPLFLKYHP